jgi:ATP-dependent Lhr-like helicase
MKPSIPTYILNWFAQRDWQMHAYQKKMFTALKNLKSTLLIVPTGGGKTLASFLPSISDIHNKQYQGLHTIYISPLKALAYDIERNLLNPIQEMFLTVKVEARTGDTSQYRRVRQRKKPPHILLTTPESLMLLLSYQDAADFFKTLKVVIIDELHSLAMGKRGDLTALALVRLNRHSPQHIRFGLSATVAHPEQLAAWLGKSHNTADIIQTKNHKKPIISLLNHSERIPYCGHMAKYACVDMYEVINNNKTTLIFVNTRMQAEFIFRELWDINQQALAIAIYHGSLSKEQRHKTATLIAAGKIRAIVATSALELGIDWGNVDCVIQVGAPKGISRLLQRIGRSNHQFNKGSRAFLVPANCFEVLECYAAIAAISHNQLDGEIPDNGSLDVIVQYIMTCACSTTIEPDDLYQEITAAYPYNNLDKAVYQQLFQFAVNGGYVLKHYDEYHRLKENPDHSYEVKSPKVRRRHRQNIGTIIEGAKLKVKRIHKRGGRILGEIEESFAQQLAPGDTFLFAGEVLEFIRVRDMLLEAKRSRSTHAKLPSYAGGTMPLSTYLADQVLALLHTPKRWKNLPAKVQNWLQLQQRFSTFPAPGSLLIEHFPQKRIFHTLIYNFAGKRANHTLASIMTLRMEKNSLRPLSFTATDYGIVISTLKKLNEQILAKLLTTEVFKKELDEWLNFSAAIKRAFRQVAIITGVTQRQLAGQRKSMKQVTFSTDLIYDVLQRYEPQHVLLMASKHEVEKNFLEIPRLISMLEKFQGHIIFKNLAKPSPLSLPILLAIKTERLNGSAVEELLTLAAAEEEAAYLIAEIQQITH